MLGAPASIFRFAYPTTRLMGAAKVETEPELGPHPGRPVGSPRLAPHLTDGLGQRLVFYGRAAGWVWRWAHS